MADQISEWLEQLGLGKYAQVFIDNEVDLDAARDLTDEDLKDLGLPLGPRKKLLRAIPQLSDQSEDQAEPQFVSKVLAEPVASIEEIERRQVAVLFADLTGYTRLSSELDPEQLNDLMEEFFKVADQAIVSFGGTVDKHLGDGVMALFGAPISHGDDTLRAVRAASAIHERLREVSSRLDHTLSAHIGIASGEVLAGAGTGEYTVIGDAVNLASRLSDLAKAKETFLSDDVHSEVIDEFLFAENSNVSIKGLQDTVSVWKLIGSRKEPVERNLLPFVGRQAECAQFRSTIKTVEAQSSGAVFIFRGEPGIGKTRLAAECLSIAVDRGFDKHQALVLDFGSGLGSDPLRTIFKSLLHATNLHDTNALRQVAKQMLAIDSFDADDEAYVCDLLDIPMSPELQAFYRAIENATRNRRKIELVGRLLEERSEQRPQIILIEDLHWADQITRDLCSSLAAHTTNCPAVLMMTSRIEGDPFDSAWRSRTGGVSVYTIDLRPLTARETKKFAQQADSTRAEALSAEMEKAGGNPLFLEMLIRSSADSQADALPGNLRSLVQARIDRLSNDDRRAIQAAAIAGQRFDLGLLRHLIGDAEYSPAPLLERSLIQPMGDQFLFTHALVQEGVYASVTRRNAQAMHLRAAEWYEKRDAVLFAEHLGRAEDERATAAYLDAANDLMAGLRFESAKNLIVKRLVNAKSDADLFLLNMSLGKAAIQTAEAELATQAYKSAIEHALTEEQECEANLGLALSYRDRPAIPVEEARRTLETADRLAKSLESRRFQFDCLYLKSYMHSLSAEIDECLQCAMAAVDLSAAEDDVALRLKALEALGMALYQNGRMRSFIPFAKEMTELSEAQDIRDWQLIAAYQLGGACFYLSQFQECIETCSTPIAEAERYGMIRAAILANEYAARSQFALGLLDEARLSAEKSLSLARSASMRARVALALIRLSEIARMAGESSASDFAEEALQNSDSLYVRPWALAVKARSESQGERAEKLLNEADSLLSSEHCTAHNHFHVRALQMEDGLDREDWSAIELAADKLDEFTKPEPLPWTDFHINRGRVLAAWGRGQKDADYERRLSQLRDTRRETGWKIWLPDDT